MYLAVNHSCFANDSQINAQRYAFFFKHTNKIACFFFLQLKMALYPLF